MHRTSTTPNLVLSIEHVGVLYARYAERIRAAAYRRLEAHGYDRRDDLHSAAEDVTQDTFTRWLELVREGYPLPTDDDETGSSASSSPSRACSVRGGSVARAGGGRGARGAGQRSASSRQVRQLYPVKLSHPRVGACRLPSPACVRTAPRS